MEPSRATFGKYTVLANLGEATMLVQRAAAAGFARLQVIRSLDDPDLLDDARVAARLQHPNIRQIHEVGTYAGEGYIALEYLEGIRYDDFLRGRSRDPALADPRLYCALLAQCCEGLHQGHRQQVPGGPQTGLVHGWLRPERLFVTSGGTVKLLDFGLHRAQDNLDPEDLANPEHYGYMAPEQVLGRNPDPRSDVFAVGVLAWESLTGRRLFSRPSRVEVLRAITQKPIPPASALAPSIPPALDQVVARALARNPDERFQTSRELGAALEEGVTTIGPPLSTVAIAACVDRFFGTELEKQRSVVLKARRELEEVVEDDFEVPTQLFGGDLADIDDFEGKIPTQPELPHNRRSRTSTMPAGPRAKSVEPARDFARPPETLSDIDDEAKPTSPKLPEPTGTQRVSLPGRGLLIVFLVLILAAAAGTAGYFYWLDLQNQPESFD